MLIPILALLNLAFAIVARRHFGLYWGVYDTALGIVATLMLFTSLGIPTSLTKFLPEVEAKSGAAAVVVFLKRVAGVRLLLLAIVLVPLNLFAEYLAIRMDLGEQGILIIRFASVLVFARVVVNLSVMTLNAFFFQLRSNLLAMLQAMLDFSLLGAAVIGGYKIGGVFGMVVVSGVVTGVVGLATTRNVLGGLKADERGSAFAPADPAATRTAVASERPRFAGFALFTFLFQMSIYFSDSAFAAPALAVVAGTERVAEFTAGFKLSFMTVGLMVASFRGLYRPMFAHLRARNDPGQLRAAFVGISKAQLVLLLPAGIGLFILAGDYIPLMFGTEYAAAVPIARVFVVMMYTQTAFNLGMIWLSIDERYRAVLWSQSILVIAAPFFLIVAGRYGLVWAAVLFGGARVFSSLAGYVLCHRWYGFRFPWRFAAKIALVASVMGAVLIGLRAFMERSVVEAIVLTMAGAVIYLVGLRIARILGPEEIDLFERSNVPGKRLALAWLAPDR